MKNITFTNFTLVDVDQVFGITQCTSYEGFTGNCDTSLFQIEDLTWGDVKGTVASNLVATLQCSGDAPCKGVNISNVAVTFNGSEVASEYSCGNVTDPIGFTCS